MAQPEWINRYLQDFDVQPEQMGQRISAGRQHTIYRYGVDEVIKIPQRSLYMKVYGPFHHETIVRDLNILLEHLGEFIIPTRVLQSRTDPDDYVIVQQWLPQSEFLTGLNYPATGDDLQRITEGNRAIIQKYRVSVDFLGNIGFQQCLKASLMRQPQRACMNNLLVVPGAERPCIRIADTNLSELRFHYHAEVGLFQWVIDSALFQITRLLIHDNFGVELL